MTPEYKAYLETDDWKIIRDRVKTRAGGLCEGCLVGQADIVHHITYDHIGNEFAFQLVALCRSCHERAHEKRHPSTPLCPLPGQNNVVALPPPIEPGPSLMPKVYPPAEEEKSDCERVVKIEGKIIATTEKGIQLLAYENGLPVATEWWPREYLTQHDEHTFYAPEWLLKEKNMIIEPDTDDGLY